MQAAGTHINRLVSLFVCLISFELTTNHAMTSFALPSIGAEALNMTAFSDEATGRIWLSNARCTGNESRLLNCSVDYSGTNDCIQVAGVRCLPGTMQIRKFSQNPSLADMSWHVMKL